MCQILRPVLRGNHLESSTCFIFEDNLLQPIVKKINLCVLPRPIVRDDKSQRDRMSRS